METQVRAAGVLNIAFGVVSAAAALTSLIYYGGIAEMATGMSSQVVGVVAVTYALFHLLVAPGLIAAGYGLLSYRNGARSALIVLSGLLILDFPAGSALGAYNLWVLLTPETEPLFARPVAKKKAAKAGDPDDDTPIARQPVRFPRESA